MSFLSEPWFWTGTFGVLGGTIGSILTLVGTITKQRMDSLHQLNVERLKVYEKDILEANKSLYQFVSKAFDQIFESGEPRKDYLVLMKSFHEKVTPHYLLYPSEVREQLDKFEQHYMALGDNAFVTDMPFEEFMRSGAFKALNAVQELIEKRTDRVYHSY
ncbi:hypothetical protein [Zavarzinella formosa]|uniref:hypothetical protein n=1 Tax=Zavarzinella formosa TaxID=360055 RepID=UPI0003635CFA|nr:hypothetical protein [Zavarzinella formosa]